MPGRSNSRALLGLALAAFFAACSPASSTAAPSPRVTATPPAPTLSPPKPPKPPVPAPSPTASSNIPKGQVRLAFAGDVHFAGSSAGALTGDLGSAVKLLKKADLAIVNLETAITDRGTAGPKEYTFRAPAAALGVLREAGIDVVNLANNHGLDYGRLGLDDTLAAGKSSGMRIIGVGADIEQAYRPYRRTINGVRISVLGATDVLDTFALNTWPATATRPGLASAKGRGTDRLVRAVRAARATSDVVVVFLHWGVEMEPCPSDRQEELAAVLTGAGAQVVVGSHAHVLEPQVREGRAAIHYGLGNFVFYATRPAAVRSGVYDVVVDRDGVVGTTWNAAEIHSGRPELLTGPAARSADDAEDELAERCGVS